MAEIVLDVVQDVGVATASAAGSLTDSSKSWTDNVWSGYAVYFPESGFAAAINGNTADTLTFTGYTPKVGELYRIYSVQTPPASDSPRYVFLPITGGHMTGNITLDAALTVDGRDISADGATLDGHVADTSNPHSVTVAQIGAVDKTGDTMSGDLTISGNDQRKLVIDSANGLGNTRVEFLDAGVIRWALQRNNSSGNFVLQRYDATGTLQDSPINIDDNTGVVDFIHSVHIVAPGGASLTLDNSDGTGDDTILFLDGGVSRWVIFREEATGSFKIGRYDSAGVWQDAPITIDANNGNIAVVGTVDGRDIAADGTTLDNHVADTNNPHSVTLDALAPTTTKGDLIVHNGTNNVRVAIGADGDVLTADSTQASGVKWSSASSGAGFDPGDIVAYGGGVLGAGWLECDGSAVSRTTYANLFAAISTVYGAGDGSTTFNLPDFRGRTIIGEGQGSGLTNRSRGDTGGAETHTLTTNQMPSHRHLESVLTGLGSNIRINYVSGSQGNTSYTGYTGSGNSHNNMQPFGVAKFKIKT